MFFQQGRNCWQVAHADRVAFLVDGEAYFGAFAEACKGARQAIYVVGWDIDSRIRLRRGEAADEETLGEFVSRLARDKNGLQIHVLEWDFAMLYSLEREFWPTFSFGWQTPAGVHFELDSNHPVGASHHQKIVVVDDRVAFVGGFDLSNSRWDTPEHRPDDPRRVDDGNRYGPFHDVQMMVEGEVAARLGDLVRQRWELATGDRLEAPETEKRGDPWPAGVEPELTDAPVAILRTEPEHDGRAEAREIEAFYLDAIGQAREMIYLENQYLTSHLVGSALEEALEKEEGPEVLLVLPASCSGWLEEQTMGALRERLLARLRQADRHQRLKICHPAREGLEGESINVHSKVMIVDNVLLTVGSANLSNRSMGFDTECNLALFADGQTRVEESIALLRNRLLAEHLGASAEAVAGELSETGSLLAAVEQLSGGPRSLRELTPEEPEESLTASEIVDPERPLSAEELIEYVGVKTGPPVKEGIRTKARRFLILIVLAALLAILWRWSPLREWLNLETMLAAAEAIREHPLAIPIVLLVYLVGSCLMVPVTLLILVTALTFGPIQGFFLALGGSLLGGLASYLIGRWLGRDVVRKLAGEKVNRLSRKIGRRGWLTVAVVRVVPIAPYTIVNMVAGSSHISTRAFLVGTALGMGPGILAIMLFEGGIERALKAEGWMSAAVAAAALVGAVLVLVFGRRWLQKKEAGDGG